MRFTHIIFATLFIASCSRSVEIEKGVRPVIGLQPLDGFDKVLMDTISNSLKSIYGYRIVLLQNQKLPAQAFVQIKSPRYRADSLLRFLLKIKPDTIDYIMGLTNQDISTSKRDRNGRILKPESKYLDWGIFGLGFRPGKSCVISTFRIYDKDHTKYMNRLKKVCVHEFGHNLGLYHCQNEKCVMQDAEETIKTVDSENLELCGACKTRIGILVESRAKIQDRDKGQVTRDKENRGMGLGKLAGACFESACLPKPRRRQVQHPASSIQYHPSLRL